MDESWQNLKALLEKRHTWPGEYTFKFVIKKELLPDMSALFPQETFKIRESANGTYLSITLTRRMHNPDEVLKIYQKASTIPGLIAL